ncbi:MAG TPA: hypothetical protein VHC69_06800 [Polyangiaceae bacterium]|nr:hypothetical protein [Polyangiaceae bacterium]
MVRDQLTARLGLRVAPLEATMLGELSARTGLSQSDVVRQLIRKEYAQVVGEPPRTVKKRKK